MAPQRSGSPVTSSAYWSFTGLYPIHVSLVHRSPELDKACQLQSHQWWAEGKDYLFCPAGSTLSHKAQDVIGPPRHKGSLLAHVPLIFNQGPRSFPAKLLFSWMPPACLGLLPRSCSFPGPGLCISPWWITWGSCQTISPDCWSLSGRQHDPLAYTSLLTVLHHLQSCWECTVPIILIINEDVEWSWIQNWLNPT